jgi:hypothetical protein
MNSLANTEKDRAAKMAAQWNGLSKRVGVYPMTASKN